MLDSYISALCRYAERTGLLQPEDLVFARNALLEALQLDSFDEAAAPAEASLADILQVLTGDAVARGVCPDNQVARDLFDTKLMGVLTPRPHEVRTCFHTLYQISPQKATDWFYRFSQDTNYIRRDRIAKDKKVDLRLRIRRAGHHHQPLQAREGPARHRRGQARTAVRLSQMRPVRGKRGLRGPHEPSRPAEPPHHPP